MNNENINLEYLPEELLEMIIDKSNTSSLYNLKKTSKLFNKITNNYLDRTTIVENKTDIFKLELSFELDDLNENELKRIYNATDNICEYIDVAKGDILNISKYNTLLVYNMIHYNITYLKESFNKFLKEHNIYNLLMNINNKYYELLINITKEQDFNIYNMQKQNTRLIFSPIGDKEEYEFIYNKLNDNIDCSNKNLKSKMIWLNMQNITKARSTIRKKNSVNINLDLTCF